MLVCNSLTKEFGISKRYPGVKENFHLNFCKKDIRSHLRTIKGGQTSLSTVRVFILACTGHLREEGANMTVCPAHHAELGIFWRPWRKCAHLVYGNLKGKPWRGLNPTISEDDNGKVEHRYDFSAPQEERTSAAEESLQLNAL